MRLISACLGGRRETVQKLLAAGVDPDGRHEAVLPGSPLVFAIMEGHAEIVRDLLDAGADPEIEYQDGFTPVYYARRAIPEIARLFEERGARRERHFDPAERAAEIEREHERQMAAYWATPIERRRGAPPWIFDYKYFENLLVRAPVPEIVRVLLAYEHARPAPTDAARDQAPDNTPVRTRQFRKTRVAVPQPAALRLSFARPRGHDWTQVRGGHRLDAARAFSNEALARYLSGALGTKAFFYGHEHVSSESYHELYDRGRRVEILPDCDEVMRAEAIYDPDVVLMPDEDAAGPDGEPILVPLAPYGPEQDGQGYRREEFAEIDSIVVEALDDAG